MGVQMRPIKIVVGLVVLLLALPSAAEEIVYFTNGQSIPIRSHEIVDGMVQMDLGDNSMLAFPEFTIDRIEIASQDVLLRPSYGTASNRRVPSPQGTFPVQGAARPWVRKEIPTDHSKASPVETDPRTGLAFYRPKGHSAAPNRHRIGVTGNMKVFGDNPTRQGTGATYTGTTQLGNRHVIGGITPGRLNGQKRGRMPISVTMKDINVDSGATPSPDDQGTPPPDGSDNR